MRTRQENVCMLPAVLFLIPKAVLITAIKIREVSGLHQRSARLFAASPISRLEKIEEFDLPRFIEQGKNVIFEDISGSTLSVDTPKRSGTDQRAV